MRGRWRIYPELAAAGLWTTAIDLAKFIIAIQDSWKGLPTGILTRSTVAKMLTPIQHDDGLGAFSVGKGATLRFNHSGENEGFESLCVGFPEAGFGAAILINGNEPTGMLDRILRQVGAKYHWPGYPPPTDQ